MHHVAALRHAARIRLLKRLHADPAEEYSGWYRAVAANIAAILADDGSYFLNIKPHADDGERNLYVMDLVIAHRRQWGWRFVDEFCWRKTDNGVPGGWGNRFKNALEPVFQFAASSKSNSVRSGSGTSRRTASTTRPTIPSRHRGAGLLGTGPRGAAADAGRNQTPGSGRGTACVDDPEGRHTGVARPSNVIEVKSESSQGSHSAPFPRPLVEFFLLAFSDPGDVVFDPFMGSRNHDGGSAPARPRRLRLRVVAGLLRRDPAPDRSTWPARSRCSRIRADVREVAEARGVPVEQALNPKEPGLARHQAPRSQSFLWHQAESILELSMGKAKIPTMRVAISLLPPSSSRPGAWSSTVTPAWRWRAPPASTMLPAVVVRHPDLQTRLREEC